MTNIPISINELPRYSKWPARLLGIEPWQQRIKNEAELNREFELELYARALVEFKSILQRNPKIEYEEYIQSEYLARLSNSLCLINGRLELLSPEEQHKSYLDLIMRELEPYRKAKAFVDMGCGAGRIILSLARNGFLKSKQLLAAEYTSSGQTLTRLLAQCAGVEMQVGHCNFFHKEITNLKIPQGAVIFTSFSAFVIPMLSDDFIKTLCTFKPLAIVHFEPCYEMLDTSTMLGLLGRRYVELNDYNRNILSLLQKHAKTKTIEVLTAKSNLFGQNPLCPCSVLAWRAS